MNKNLYVILMAMLAPVYLYAEDRSESSLSGSISKVKHNHSINTNDGELIKSTLDKGGVTYEYVWTGERRAVVRKTNDQGKVNLLSIGGENEIQLGGSAGSIPLDHWTVLLDVSESAANLRLLFQCPQTFLYAEFSRKYPELKVPDGDQLIKTNDRFDNFDLKPNFYVNFIPDGIRVDEFVGKISISEKAGVDLTRKNGIIDKYRIKDGWMQLNGEPFARLVQWTAEALESDIIKGLQKSLSKTDDTLKLDVKLMIKEEMIDNNGNLQGSARLVLDSIRNRELALNVQNRIRNLYLEIRNQE